jgi:hypothetical protein
MFVRLLAVEDAKLGVNIEITKCIARKIFNFWCGMLIFQRYYLNNFNVKEKEKVMGSGIIMDHTHSR